MPTTRVNRYQEGSFERVARATGPDVWMYRWRETDSSGKRVQRKRTIGSVKDYPREPDARRAVESLRAEVNAQEANAGKMTVGQAWGHFQAHELYDPAIDRSPTTIDNYLNYFKGQILPAWRDVYIEDVKAVAVEKWLRGLDRADGTKAKIRNHLSALFTHLIRHELYERANPIATVRQSAVREEEPEILTLGEMKALLAELTHPAISVMVAMAAVTAFRRSELRGMQWRDLDLTRGTAQLVRGLVNKHQTKLKTKASKKTVPLHPELIPVLEQWRVSTPYPADEDWVFASPFTEGQSPYWPDSALKDHVRPAASRAGITKQIGWHTFRHSMASILGESGTELKTVQELLQHATPRITLEVYQQASQGAKRAALSSMAGLFDLPEAQTA